MKETQTKPEETSLLKQAFLAIQEMQAKLDRVERRNTEPIAIVGMGCRFPGGVVDGETFWNLLREGRDAISLVPPERWDVEAYYDPDPDAPGKMVTHWGGFLDQVDKFDAGFFEIAPREAAGMDPQQRLALEVAWEALENAGIAPAGLQGSKTGVFLGIASGDYSHLSLATGDPELLDAHYASGVAHSIAAGRISYLLGLEGPSISLDTACSSSLVAVHLASQSLRAGDCSLALAGGVNVMLAPETTALLSRVRMLAPDGRCKAFDASADGFVRGEGCGFVALKTLSQAQIDGDRILAVIRGSAVNQDGASSSLTAPNGPSQVSLMRQALAGAGVLPGQVSYVEAHGTGTALGDPIELQALGAVYGASRPVGKPLNVASLKTNVGHLEAAAGVAGLIKTVLALQHRQIPPHRNVTRLTPHVRWEELRLTVPRELMEWEAEDNSRMAAVSSFGFSGTNAHVVVAEAPSAEIVRSETGWPVQILAISAKSKTALQRLVEQYREILDTRPDIDLRDVCFTVNTGRSHFPYRACFLAPDVESMRQQLASFEVSAKVSEPGRVGFLFTGQGSQYARMGRELYGSSAVFREAMDECAAAWQRETGESLIAALYPAEGEASRLDQAKYAQPALFAFEYALAKLWQSWGMEPSVLLGHSLGEYVAAVIAGVFTMEDGLRLVCARARLMDTLSQPGAMRSVSATAERVRAELAGFENEVSIAAVNGPESVAISGAAEAVARVTAKLEAEGIRTRALAVTHGFHSPLLEPILEEFEACAREVKYAASRIRMISNRTGETAKAEEMATPGYWREQMRSTVLFHAGLETALATGCETWIEIGPQPHLLSLGKSSHSNAKLLWLPSVRKGRNAWLDLLSAVQALYESGEEINWTALHGKSGRPIALPTYPFERQRHWFPQDAVKKLPSIASDTVPAHPLLGSRLFSPLEEIQFESRIGPGQPAYLGDHVVGGQRVVPASGYLEIALGAAAAVTEERVVLTSIAFLRPCVFDEPRRLQCVLRQSGEAFSFAIYSRAETPAAGEEEWTLHATGGIDHGNSAGIANRIADESLDAIRMRCLQESDASSFYRSFAEHGAGFGANFQSVTRIFRGIDEALVELKFSQAILTDTNLYNIHPVALDGCLQAVVALLSEDGVAYLPASLESLKIGGDPRHLAYAYARVSNAAGQPLTADVVGFDRAGTVLVVANGLTMLPIARGSFAASRTSDPMSKSFYEVKWIPVQPEQAQEHGVPETCLLCGDLATLADLRGAFEQRGISCTIVERDKDGALDISAAIRANDRSQAAPVSDCVYVAPAVENLLRLNPDRLMELEAESLGECLQLAQSLLQIDRDKAPRLWIVTKGAQGPALSNAPHSALWGFGRSVAAEHPELRVMRIDLDPANDSNAEDLLRCMRSAGVEDELAVRGREVYAPRLRAVTSLSSKSNALPDGDESNLHLEIAQPGTIEGIESVPAPRRNPGPGEIEIRVHAAGLNFRDVLSVLGMYQGKSGPLGGECAGTVLRVGPGVESLQPGDEVIALGQGCFARFVTANADMAWRKPANLSFEAAVTIPIAFLTACYGLNSIAKIRPGERVLIHAGAGGVGLAAIQVAVHAGAIVFATAGSAEKREYLRSVGVVHVMDSRTLEFAREIREITGGRGVDVVLNSLTGPFINAGIEALSPGGRFLEMGVADIRSRESVASLRPDIAYHAFNLASALQTRETFVREIVAAVLRQFASGDFQPLPREIFSMENARDAFRYMAQARHIGRVVICPAKELAVGVRRDGAYLVTGGMSGIGLAVAEWLGQRGAAHVVVMGRSAPDSQAAEVFSGMRSAGTTVSVHLGNVAEEQDVHSALAQAKDVPLRGIFHCAGVLDDGVLLEQDWPRFERVLLPKAVGALNLHRLTANTPLDHFVLFSSVASVFGSPGQTNYAAANAVLDGLAQYRRAHGLPGLSINWGAWSETGVAMRYGVIERGSKIGIGGISTEDGLHALELLLAHPRAQIAVSPIDWKMYFAGVEAAPPILQDLRTGRAADSAAFPVQKKKQSSWLPELENAAPARRRDLLLRLLSERVQATLGLSAAQEIDPAQPLQELGLDSLLSIELRNALSACLNRGLPATLLFNYPTLNALAGFILREILVDATLDANQQTMEQTMSSPVSLVDDIEALSDEDVDRLLSARAAGGVQ